MPVNFTLVISVLMLLGCGDPKYFDFYLTAIKGVNVQGPCQNGYCPLDMLNVMHKLKWSGHCFPFPPVGYLQIRTIPLFLLLYFLFSVQLQKLGFTNVDAVDPNEEMLKEAQRHNVYKNTICDYVGKNKLTVDNGKLILVTLIIVRSSVNGICC